MLKYNIIKLGPEDFVLYDSIGGNFMGESSWEVIDKMLAFYSRVH